MICYPTHFNRFSNRDDRIIMLTEPKRVLMIRQHNTRTQRLARFVLFSHLHIRKRS
ncbi:hypothetical protein Hanom_Chr04g00364861 [Helianthus anomalus]